MIVALLQLLLLATSMVRAVAGRYTSFVGASTNIYVEPILGDDLADGNSPSTAFRTLQRAADALASSQSSTKAGADTLRTVHLLPGEYVIDRPLVLNDRHRNSVWKAKCDDGNRKCRDRNGVRIRGGHRLSPHLFQPWDGRAGVFLAPIGESAGDLGEIRSGLLADCANSKAELIFDGKPLTLARYPNIDTRSGSWRWNTIQNVTGDASFTFAGRRPIEKKYSEASDLWLHGYWKYDWADNYVKVLAVDSERTSFIIDTNASQVLYTLKDGARYYAVNLLQELDIPGEYFIDRERRLLYVYPPDGGINAESEIILSTIENLVTAKDISNLIFEGIDFSISRGTALNFTNITAVSVVGGSITNIGGSEAVRLWDSKNSRVDGVTLNYCACGGIKIMGGNRSTLTPSGITIRSNRISNFARWKRTYQSGVYFEGCGHHVHGNSIFDAPHEGISGRGNDCIVSENHLYDLCYEGVDAGAFYAGRSWAERGNIVRNNRFERIRTTENASLGYSHVQAIYLDDQVAGYRVINNTIIDSDTGILLGGGRDNHLIGNKFIRTALPLSFDNRGLTWDNERCKPNNSFQDELRSYNYKRPPWSLRYPEVINTFHDRPCTPVHNIISDFKFCGYEKTWIETPGTSIDELAKDNIFADVSEDRLLCNSSFMESQSYTNSWIQII